MVRTQIQLTEEQAALVKQIAAERQVSMANVIREALDRSLQSRTIPLSVGDRIQRDVGHRFAEHQMEDQPIVDRTARQTDRSGDFHRRSNGKARAEQTEIECQITLGHGARCCVQQFLADCEVFEIIACNGFGFRHLRLLGCLFQFGNGLGQSQQSPALLDMQVLDHAAVDNHNRLAGHLGLGKGGGNFAGEGDLLW